MCSYTEWQRKSELNSDDPVLHIKTRCFESCSVTGKRMKEHETFSTKVA